MRECLHKTYTYAQRHVQRGFGRLIFISLKPNIKYDIADGRKNQACAPLSGEVRCCRHNAEHKRRARPGSMIFIFNKTDHQQRRL